MNAVPLPYEGKSVVGMGFSTFRDTYGVAIGAAHNFFVDDKERYSITLAIQAGMAGDEYGVAGGAGFNF